MFFQKNDVQIIIHFQNMILLSARTTKSQRKKKDSKPQVGDGQGLETTKSVPLKKLTLMSKPEPEKSNQIESEQSSGITSEPGKKPKNRSNTSSRPSTTSDIKVKLKSGKIETGKPHQKQPSKAVVRQQPAGKSKPRPKPITKAKPKQRLKPKVKRVPRAKVRAKVKAQGKAKGKSEKDEGVPENLKWLTEDPQEALLSRFVETPKGTKLGESIGIDKSRLILKNKLKFYSIPLNSVKEKGDILVLVRKVNWKLAAKLGENWRKRTLDVLNVDSTIKSKVIKIN
jgi:hypothetical protein